MPGRLRSVNNTSAAFPAPEAESGRLRPRRGRVRRGAGLKTRLRRGLSLPRPLASPRRSPPPPGGFFPCVRRGWGARQLLVATPPCDAEGGEVDVLGAQPEAAGAPVRAAWSRPGHARQLEWMGGPSARISRPGAVSRGSGGGGGAQGILGQHRRASAARWCPSSPLRGRGVLWPGTWPRDHRDRRGSRAPRTPNRTPNQNLENSTLQG